MKKKNTKIVCSNEWCNKKHIDETSKNDRPMTGLKCRSPVIMSIGT